MDTDGFGELVQQAEMLTAKMSSGSELPRVERNLHQIKEAAQRMASKAPLGAQDTTDVKACLLLGSRGYDMQKVRQQLESLSAAKSFEPLEPVRETDIQGFLRNERENALLAVIEQTRKHTFEEVEKHHWQCLENEWEQEKQKILSALVGSGQDSFTFPKEPDRMMHDSVNLKSRSALNDVEMAYAKQVYLYNEDVIKGGLVDSLTDKFVSIADELNDVKVSELWNMVHFMTDVPLSTSASPQDSRKSAKVEMAFVNQARKYLESSFKKYIETLVFNKLHQANLGGIPGTYHLVRSFLNIQLPGNTPGLEDGIVDGHPVWAMIYYCLRCGDRQAVYQVLNSAQQHLDDFAPYLLEYIKSDEGRLCEASETKLRLHYRRSVRTSTDPYKRAVHCVIGRCDPKDHHTEIATVIDHYLWIKLCQLSCENDSSADQLTFAQLQSLLLEEYGESHFSAMQQPFIYFQVMILTAQFEAAIEFMSRIEQLRCHALHVALVLYEKKMLLLSSNIQAQLLSTDASLPKPMRRLNFARLVMMYTRKFEATDPREALQYLYFLREIKSPQGENLFMSCVSDLVRETREFEMLLGQIDGHGSRKPGAIDKFQGDTQKIIELVAKDTEEKGMFEDAIKLYDLAKSYEKVLELLNKLVTQVVSHPSSSMSQRDRLKSLAVSIAQRYRSLGVEGSKHTTNTFYLLLDLMTFFDYYHSGKLEQASQIIQDLKLLPFSSNTVEQKVSAFKHYTDEIRRSLPEILLATMNILHMQYKNTRNSSHSPLTGKALGIHRSNDGGVENYISHIRSQARALITFAGMIPYRMPGDTNARLVQMEVLMN